MKKNIILNVDDFGLTAGVNQAVFDLNEAGVLKSTTALVNSPYFQAGIIEAQNHPSLGVGIHLTIDLYQAEIYQPSLCDENLKFHTAKTHDLTRGLDTDLIYNEWKAQIEKFKRYAGKLPTHIDSHHHAHIINRDAFLAVQKLAAEYDLPVRGLETDKFKAIYNEDFYASGVSVEHLCSIIRELLATDGNYLDVMMHPAIVDQELMAITSYNQTRGSEYQIVLSPEFKQFITENNINITNYTEIR